MAAPSRRLMHGLSLLLILGACGLLGQSAWIEAKAWLAQELIGRAWRQSQVEDRPVRPWAWADTWPVARLSAPRLGVERIVLAGVSGRTLAFGPGWAEQSAAPGAPGRSLLAGHRDTHFSFLADLVKGDRLSLQAADGETRRYRVVALSVVEDDASWLMSPWGEDELLLLTCYPFDSPVPGGSQRYLVRAVPL
ncbi:MAG: class GN sortase [Candidatus Thiodiazotropha sp.]